MTEQDFERLKEHIAKLDNFEKAYLEEILVAQRVYNDSIKAAKKRYDKAVKEEK